MEQKRDVLYLVKIDSAAIDRTELGFMLTRTYAYPMFCGYLVNHANGRMWFEVNNKEKPLVCIPTSWIEWMAQSKNQTSLDKDEPEENNEC